MCFSPHSLQYHIHEGLAGALRRLPLGSAIIKIFGLNLQGMGVAANTPAALGIIGHAFPPGDVSKFRSLAFAAFSAGA